MSVASVVLNIQPFFIYLFYFFIPQPAWQIVGNSDDATAWSIRGSNPFMGDRFLSSPKTSKSSLGLAQSLLPASRADGVSENYPSFIEPGRSLQCPYNPVYFDLF